MKRKYWNECVSLALIFVIGAFYSFFAGNIESGLIPGSELWERFRNLVHGIPMCPFCGASRSFVFMCRGEIVTALHYSFFGVFFFFSALFHFISKFILLYFEPSEKFRRFIEILDEKFPLTIMIFVLWGIQLALHFSGIFLWRTLS